MNLYKASSFFILCEFVCVYGFTVSCYREKYTVGKFSDKQEDWWSRIIFLFCTKVNEFFCTTTNSESNQKLPAPIFGEKKVIAIKEMCNECSINKSLSIFWMKKIILLPIDPFNSCFVSFFLEFSFPFLPQHFLSLLLLFSIIFCSLIKQLWIRKIIDMDLRRMSNWNVLSVEAALQQLSQEGDGTVKVVQRSNTVIIIIH